MNVMNRKIVTSLILLLTTSTWLWAQSSSPEPRGQESGTGPQSSDTRNRQQPDNRQGRGGQFDRRDQRSGPPNGNANGPWNNDVLVYRGTADGRMEKLATFERAGVPTVARLNDGRLIAAHQHFPENDPAGFDRVAVHFSLDEGRTWTEPQVITVNGLPEGMRFPFDPTLVPLPDGHVRLYFTGNFIGQADSTPAIHSAISENGLIYTYEPGPRFAIDGRAVIDCAVAIHNGVFHLYAPDNGAGANPGEPRGNRPIADRPRDGVGYHATSSDGLNFEQVNDVRTDSNSRWLGNVQSDGKQMLFFGTGQGPWPLASDDGIRWTAAGMTWRIPGADPGAVKLKDDSWLFVLTGPPVRQVSPGRMAAPNGRGAPPMPEVRSERGQQSGAFPGRPAPMNGFAEYRVEKVDSRYSVAPAAKEGTFVTGQKADMMLGGFGFNQSGGASLFNHPSGLATDGTALLMTDRWNNRVLIWKSAPASNSPPDLVLGQPDFTRNESGNGLHQMNWPGNVSISPDGRRIAVTDTNNDRILIWNSFPTRHGQAADLVLELSQFSDHSAPPKSGTPQSRFGGIQRLGWPWGVWTDGTKLAVVATHGSAVLIWNQFPMKNNQPPDFILRPQGAGTPRNITSDGRTFFAVSDHNFGDHSRPATMVWNSFPTSATQAPDWTWRAWVKGSFTPDGGLVVAGIHTLYLYRTPPKNELADADVIFSPQTYRNGDGPDAVIANGRLYVCTYNGNHLLGWNSIPTRDDQPADFAIGSERTDQDTWAENYFIQNPVVATDGRSLFVTSDFDRKMFVWRQLPNESGAKPDLVMHLPDGPWDNELHGSTLATAGRSSVSIWTKLPLNGESPDMVFSGHIGSAELGELTGVAFDETYFYLADRRNECILVWKGLPNQNSEPAFVLKMRSPGRLTSDGNYLCAAPFEGNSIQVWRVSELSSDAQPITLGGRGQFNLPSECLVANGQLFVCNRSFNRVDVWNRAEDALSGHPPDALLGATDEQDRNPGVSQNQLFMPGSLAWGNGSLWVGEFKFSTRILRFSPANH